MSAVKRAAARGRRVLEHAAHDDVTRLRLALAELVDAVETMPRSERLHAQHDEEFRNLARAARLEVTAVRGALSRLDAFAEQLGKLLYPDDEGGQS